MSRRIRALARVLAVVAVASTVAACNWAPANLSWASFVGQQDCRGPGPILRATNNSYCFTLPAGATDQTATASPVDGPDYFEIDVGQTYGLVRVSATRVGRDESLRSNADLVEDAREYEQSWDSSDGLAAPSRETFSVVNAQRVVTADTENEHEGEVDHVFYVGRWVIVAACVWNEGAVARSTKRFCADVLHTLIVTGY